MYFGDEHYFPFLHVMITKNNDGNVANKVHMKKTHTYEYLHAISYHHPS